jgi:hypothetical protein
VFIRSTTANAEPADVPMMRAHLRCLGAVAWGLSSVDDAGGPDSCSSVVRSGVDLGAVRLCARLWASSVDAAAVWCVLGRGSSAR